MAHQQQAALPGVISGGKARLFWGAGAGRIVVTWSIGGSIGERASEWKGLGVRVRRRGEGSAA